MKKIVIVGGGFAGISAVKTLAKSKLELVLIDKKQSWDFLPCLPDILSQKINPVFLTVNLADFIKKLGGKFINQEVKSVDLAQKNLKLDSQDLSYDYLLLCSGTKTNFFGNSEMKRQALKLDSIADAELILSRLEKDDFDKIVVIGGGYTGIEIATNLRQRQAKPISIIEKSPNLLGTLPQWMKDYVKANLDRLNIEVLASSEISQIPKRTLLIWSAGVKSDDYIFNLKQNKTPQGRLKVDKYLKITDNCFVAGDIANFDYRSRPLRMSIQFAITQGRLAARNIINSIKGKPLTEYKPKDLGYVIPMPNNKSCGLVLGLRVKSRLATFLHYFMCIFRSESFKNKLGIIKNLIKGGA
ncbi:MAG: FAD-dependent oxidoreductase [Candidatus Omnitrophica bacterium]|nr:FAD-dependent oxidoreductase [Candidatus Omnitrophota bacterium]